MDSSVGAVALTEMRTHLELGGKLKREASGRVPPGFRATKNHAPVESSLPEHCASWRIFSGGASSCDALQALCTSFPVPVTAISVRSEE